MDKSSNSKQPRNIDQQPKRDILVMNDEMKCLDEYRNGLLMKKNDFSGGERGVQSALQSLIDVKSSDHSHAESSIAKESAEFDSGFIPYTSYLNSESINCLGCGQSFKQLSTTSEPAFYIHCIKECDAYKSLNLIVNCSDCHKLFVNSISMGQHSCGRPTKPDWMTPAMYSNGFQSINSIKRCQGCSKSIPSHSNNASYEYLIHVIEECSKTKDLIRECRDCCYKFPNELTYNIHRKNAHRTYFHPDPKPLKPVWMTVWTYRRSINVSEGKFGPASCKGCGQELRIMIPNGMYRFEDYVHMIEECVKYKELGLIQTCFKCNCKFINAAALSHHKCELKNLKNFSCQ